MSIGFPFDVLQVGLCLSKKRESSIEKKTVAEVQTSRGQELVEVPFPPVESDIHRAQGEDEIAITSRRQSVQEVSHHDATGFPIGMQKI